MIKVGDIVKYGKDYKRLRLSIAATDTARMFRVVALDHPIYKWRNAPKHRWNQVAYIVALDGKPVSDFFLDPRPISVSCLTLVKRPKTPIVVSET